MLWFEDTGLSLHSRIVNSFWKVPLFPPHHDVVPSNSLQHRPEHAPPLTISNYYSVQSTIKIKPQASSISIFNKTPLGPVTSLSQVNALAFSGFEEATANSHE